MKKINTIVKSNTPPVTGDEALWVDTSKGDNSIKLKVKGEGGKYTQVFTAEGMDISDLEDKIQENKDSINKINKALAAKEDAANKVTSIGADANNTTFPTTRAVLNSIAEVKNIEVTPEMLSESTKQYINASGGGTITNFADDEDLTTVDNALKLADKTYDPITFSGMGRVYLRKNIVDGKNILTQEMMTKENTIYIIQYDYDLNGTTITIPENCILKFCGGNIVNGTIVFNKTYLEGAVSIVKCVLKGDILNESFHVDWFGAKVNSTQDSTDAFKVISDYAYQRFLDNGSNVVYCTRKLILSPGTYCVTNINLQGGINLIGAGSYSTVIKSISDTDKAVVTINRNDTIIRDLAIDGGAKEGYQNIGLYMYGNNGQNSIVDNVRFINCYKKSVVVEDTNHVILSHCAFNGGHEGFVLLDGADNIKVLNCNFETGEEFTAPYAIKLQTEITINKTANNAIISGCWFESGSAETFKTSIYVDCMNVTIENNHFHAATACVKDYVCYVGDNTDNIKFIYNNIQNTGTNESGEKEKILGVSENAQIIYVAYNRGMWNANNTEILNSKTFVIFMDGSQLLPNNHTIVTNEVPFYIKTTSANSNIYKGAFRYNNAWIWYDLNQVLKIKYGSAPNNAYDGEPIGNYVAAAWSDGYPASTKYQIGRCYFDRSDNSFTIWNGTAWVRVSDGVSKDIPTFGNSNQKPNNADVPVGYMYYDITHKRYVVNDGTEWRLPNGYINNTAGGSGIRPTEKLSSVDAGFMFFDTTLNKPIWWTGSAWVDATGQEV